VGVTLEPNGLVFCAPNAAATAAAIASVFTGTVGTLVVGIVKGDGVTLGLYPLVKS
tara:strand:- start:1468 stop:1635 length:168 start_codon:yes stop_codon:yes gene_type:complete